MKFKFNGEGNEDPEEIELFGYKFPEGEWVEVSEPAAIKKLQANSHFEAAKAKKPVDNLPEPTEIAVDTADLVVSIEDEPVAETTDDPPAKRKYQRKPK